jgi:NAD(P)-dependent dehydrogenase (short-subunit alcohol dehydrogenase family)
MATTLITGANRGIGLELVRQYAADGWRVHAACRRPDEANDLREIAEAHPDRVHVHALDVTDHDAVDALAATLRGEPIDVLLNNAGLHGERDKGPAEVDHAVWMDAIRVNAMAPLKVTAAFLPHVDASEQRRIVVVTSLMGSIGANEDGGNYVYRSSKAAANAVARSLAVELAPRGIAVLALHPGWVRTEMGGPEAPYGVEESVRGIRKVISGLSVETAGTFLDFRGETIPW